MSDLVGEQIAIRSVAHTFQGQTGSTKALAGVNLEIAAGEFVAIVGPSGCGKSTLLSLISGLEKIQSGNVEIGGHPVDGIRRDAGMMLQSESLLPWRTVRGNIELALRIRRHPKTEVTRRADAWIRRIGLEGFAEHYPRELSGGMRKRVQLAATMVYEPAILLMDEPFSALDALTRNVMEDELLRIWSNSRSTVVFVTHDLDEAIALADRVVVSTARPMRVKASYEIPIPRPRSVAEIQSAPGFGELRHRIWSDLRDEVSAAGDPGSAAVPEPGPQAVSTI